MIKTKESLLGQADALHDLARRCRRLSGMLTLESDQRRLTRSAEEFEENAKRLEREAAGAKTNVIKPVIPGYGES
jgi:molecular chaperone GrpE (heat shock protein)